MDSPLPPEQPTFLAWLARNPTDIPHPIALSRALLGSLLAGLVSVTVARRARRAAPTAALVRETLGAVLVGGTAGPLCVTAATYHLDRALLRRDALLGYSGVMRELFHAGELSFLTALGAGLGRSVAGPVGGVVVGTIGTGAIGAAVYTARGLGPGLGAEAGLLSGLVGSLLARVVVRSLP